METPLPSSSSPREGLGRFGVKLYRYRNLVLRQWWILALTVGIGLAYQGWILSQKPPTSSPPARSHQGGTDRHRTASSRSTVRRTSSAPDVHHQERAASWKRRGQPSRLSTPELAGPTPEIAVSMIPRTQIFVITGTGSNPEYTREFVDALVVAFMEYRRDTKARCQRPISSGHGEKSPDESGLPSRGRETAGLHDREQNAVLGGPVQDRPEVPLRPQESPGRTSRRN